MHEAKEVSTKNEAGAILKGMMVRHETCKRSQSKSKRSIGCMVNPLHVHNQRAERKKWNL